MTLEKTLVSLPSSMSHGWLVKLRFLDIVFHTQNFDARWRGESGSRLCFIRASTLENNFSLPVCAHLPGKTVITSRTKFISCFYTTLWWRHHIVEFTFAALHVLLVAKKHQAANYSKCTTLFWGNTFRHIIVPQPQNWTRSGKKAPERLLWGWENSSRKMKKLTAIA